MSVETTEQIATTNATVLAPLTPIIADAEEYKYYRVPAGMKNLRTKRKVAIVFGYVGERYCGLQWNHLPEYPTVEEALLKALFECDMISMTNFANGKVQQLLNFERASRTDKGVHALRNVVSVCLMLPYDKDYVANTLANSADVAAADENNNNNNKDDGDDSVKYSFSEAKRLLNLALPSDIHVYDIVPVTRSFNAYLNCGGRIYEYYLPTYALMNKADYDSRFFPPQLAPSNPTLQEVGLTAKQMELYAQKQQQKLQEAAAGNNNNNDDASREPKGRKNKGHFPKRKSARHNNNTAVGDNVDEADTPLDDVTESAESPVVAEEATVVTEASAVPTAEADTNQPACSSTAGDATNNKAEDCVTANRFHDGLLDTLLLFRSVPEEAMRHVAQSYRMPSEQLERVRELFAQYEGTHCYHNFTPGGRSTDPSCHRYIQHVTVSEPFIVKPDDDTMLQSLADWSPSRFFSPDERIAEEYAAMLEAAKGQGEGDEAEVERLRQHLRDRMKRVYGPNGLEVVRIELDGQSFMLNQIRKMIGAVICLAATDMPASFVRETLLRKGERRGIPMAPANGLFLSFLDFSRYNYRLERIQHGGNAACKHPLDMTRVSEEELRAWRAKTVAVVLRNEMAEDVMGRWMRSLRSVLRVAWGMEFP